MSKMSASILTALLALGAGAAGTSVAEAELAPRPAGKMKKHRPPAASFAPAEPGADYKVAVTGAGRDVVSMSLVYRADFGAEKSAPMKSDSPGGERWVGAIPAADLPAPGHLVRWAAVASDASGREWRTPSFRDPEDDPKWFGTIVRPAAGQESASLQTFHLFADDEALKLMDRQYDEVSGRIPLGARLAVYDSQTGRFYDNVRFDLRGHNSARLKKKSHGVRFNKGQPLECENPFDGERLRVRKTSFVADYADPSFVRQALSVKVMRDMGMPTPFFYPVRLNLNGEFYELAFHSNRFADELIESYYRLDPEGFAFKSAGTCARGTLNPTRKVTPDDKRPNDLRALEAFRKSIAAVESVDEGQSSLPADGIPEVTRAVAASFDLPAWLNYLAVTHVTQETDDVWANLGLYGDVYGTGAWMPLAYDLHASWGAFYWTDDPAGGRTGARADWDGYKSHPFYGGLRVRCHDQSGKVVFLGNNAFEAVWQHPKFRRLYLRRLRSVMDAVLQPPGGAKEDSPVWRFVELLQKAMAADAALDRAKWGDSYREAPLYPWPRAMTPAEGAADLWDNYVVPRRTHLYKTHSAASATAPVGYGREFAAGIPDAQAPTAELRAGFSAAAEAGAVRTLAISNANDAAVDMSGWELSGAVRWRFPEGSVVDAHDVIRVTSDRAAYVRARGDSLGAEVIVGNAGRIGAGRAELRDADGERVVSFELR